VDFIIKFGRIEHLINCVHVFFLTEEQPLECIAETYVAERFSCEHCEKTFAHKSGLNTHLNTHKGNDFKHTRPI